MGMLIIGFPLVLAMVFLGIGRLLLFGTGQLVDLLLSVLLGRFRCTRVIQGSPVATQDLEVEIEYSVNRESNLMNIPCYCAHRQSREKPSRDHRVASSGVQLI
jgi:low affinity Fe/Cu permease